MKSKVILFLFLLFAQFIFGNKEDSLRKVIATSKNDSIVCKTAYKLGLRYAMNSQFDSAFKYISKANAGFIKKNYLEASGYALRDLGEIFMIRDMKDSSVVYLIKAERQMRKANTKGGLAKVLSTLGQIKTIRGELKLAKKILWEAASLNMELKATTDLGTVYQHLGGLYLINESRNLDSSLFYYSACYQLQKSAKNEYRTALALANMAQVYKEKNMLPRALNATNEAVNIFKKLNRRNEVAGSYIVLGDLLAESGSHKEALEKYKEAEKNLDSDNSKDYRMVLYQNMSSSYYALGKFKESADYKNYAYALKDSIYNESSSNQIAELEKKYESEKQESEISKLNNEKSISDLELKQKSRVLLIVLAGLAIAVVLSVLLIRNINKQRKATKIIKSQNLQLEQKNKDITDSILYAKKIQDALLPHTEEMATVFPDSFVLFKPRDIVSGDFFWFNEMDNKTIVAVCDCTGHGVPGAFRSLIGYEMLNQIITEEKISDPAIILQRMDEKIFQSLNKSSSGHHDGMDVGLMVLDKKTMVVEFAGAYRPMQIVRNTEPATLVEVQGNKFSLGGHKTAAKKEFTKAQLHLNKGDVLYLYSDGFADQFGGLKGKKFMQKNLKEMFLKMSRISMKEQIEKLDTAFESWKGKHEQVDDVCVIGVRL